MITTISGGFDIIVQRRLNCGVGEIRYMWRRGAADHRADVRI